MKKAKQIIYNTEFKVAQIPINEPKRLYFAEKLNFFKYHTTRMDSENRQLEKHCNTLK